MDGNIKEVELAAMGNSAAGPQQRDVKADVLVAKPEAQQGKPDLEAAEPSRPADVAHLEIPRARKWRGRYSLCRHMHTSSFCSAVYRTGLALPLAFREGSLADGRLQGSA